MQRGRVPYPIADEVDDEDTASLLAAEVLASLRNWLSPGPDQIILIRVRYHKIRVGYRNGIYDTFKAHAPPEVRKHDAAISVRTIMMK